jgi:hypothetical protein
MATTTTVKQRNWMTTKHTQIKQQQRYNIRQLNETKHTQIKQQQQ